MVHDPVDRNAICRGEAEKEACRAGLSIKFRLNRHMA
jgi:hypothetical protein